MSWRPKGRAGRRGGCHSNTPRKEGSARMQVPQNQVEAAARSGGYPDTLRQWEEVRIPARTFAGWASEKKQGLEAQ